jgi:maltose O-acetyltransferase
MQAVGSGIIEFGNSVKIGVFPSPQFFSTYAYLEARKPSARITIGAETWINNNFTAIAEHTSITIGRNCLIGANVEILDSDFHGLRIQERMLSKPEWAKPVSIGNNVFIGSNVKIMKGVSIGDGCVVANGTIVFKDVPPSTVIGGSPTAVLKVLSSE